VVLPPGLESPPLLVLLAVLPALLLVPLDPAPPTLELLLELLLLEPPLEVELALPLPVLPP
jgi:hypothetical protein